MCFYHNGEYGDGGFVQLKRCIIVPNAFKGKTGQLNTFPFDFKSEFLQFIGNSLIGNGTVQFSVGTCRHYDCQRQRFKLFF